MMVLAGVAGQPITHSLSPLIHKAWIEAAGLKADYHAFEPADATAFAALVADGRAGRLRGLNVTAPFKAQALTLADSTSLTARTCGSANLLVFEANRVSADSTDGAGLMAALAEQAPGLNLRDRFVVVLGAGGAARAAVAALRGEGARVGVVNRTPARAAALAADLGATAVTVDSLGAAALVVNALSVPPDIDLARLCEDAVLMDMTYRPLITPFLAQGLARGLAVVDGLAMLIGQARPSFEILFGCPPPDIDIRGRVLVALGEGS